MGIFACIQTILACRILFFIYLFMNFFFSNFRCFSSAHKSSPLLVMTTLPTFQFLDVSLFLTLYIIIPDALVGLHVGKRYYLKCHRRNPALFLAQFFVFYLFSVKNVIAVLRRARLGRTNRRSLRLVSVAHVKERVRIAFSYFYFFFSFFSPRDLFGYRTILLNCRIERFCKLTIKVSGI